MQQKTIWMLLLGIGILSSLFLSCRTIVDGRQLVEFRYVNNTNYTILIINYEEHVKEVNLIAKQDSLVQETDVLAGRSLGDMILFSDSVDIIFDNSRILKVRRRNMVDSLLVFKYVFDRNRYDKYERNHVKISVYKFTDADYQSASDCDGGCNGL